MAVDVDGLGGAAIRQGVVDGTVPARQISEWHLARIESFDGPITARYASLDSRTL